MPALWLGLLATGFEGSARAAVLARLRSVILAGLVPPGAPINVDDVADRLLISRVPVREALRTLITEGLVEHEERGGFSVCHVTRDELSELYTVREALERAALRAAVERATADDDAAVRRAYDDLTSSIDAHDGRGHQRGSKAFHFAMVRACGMRRLVGTLEQAWNLTLPAQPMAYLSPRGRRALHEEHRAMAEAFAARDTDGLLTLSALHYRRNQHIVRDLPEDSRLRPD
ncbi:putative GntR family transcriptional regulator [Actinacidiphila reveromycinica]|uniref:Putative GntR family transcriptional regulator n=2 Tax=Actinacidiphila reveromycinica TaxID=659352 RepID=A0A7U3VPP9_9ACTN|nr:putative GntR family transcriptional regulator [Streptomyces sp. SN-593]